MNWKNYCKLTEEQQKEYDYKFKDSKKSFWNYILIASIFLISIVAFDIVCSQNYVTNILYGNSSTLAEAQSQVLDNLNVNNKLLFCSLGIMIFAFIYLIYLFIREDIWISKINKERQHEVPYKWCGHDVKNKTINELMGKKNG